MPIEYNKQKIIGDFRDISVYTVGDWENEQIVVSSLE